METHKRPRFNLIEILFAMLACLASWLALPQLNEWIFGQGMTTPGVTGNTDTPLPATGQTPTPSLTDTPFPTLTASPVETYSTPTPGLDGRIIYIVQVNDSCASISALTGVPVEIIRSLNNLDENCSISPGQQLVIHAGSTATFTPTPEPTSTISPFSLSGGIELCDGVDYSGECLTYAFSGQQTCTALGNMGDRAESLRFTGEYASAFQVNLYDDDFCQNYLTSYWQDAPSLFEMSNTASSMLIQYLP